MNTINEAKSKLEISQLAQAAQVCGIASRSSLPLSVRAAVAKADASKRPLSIEELKGVCASRQTSELAVGLLMAGSHQIVDTARGELLKRQPQLTLPGGDLYPEPRAEACWRDCQEFLRVIIYGVACNCAEITDATGMAALRQLYTRMGVPVSAMMYALNQMRILSSKILETSGHNHEMESLNMAFADLIKALQPNQPMESRS